jgi:hypothetical protein
LKRAARHCDTRQIPIGQQFAKRYLLDAGALPLQRMPDRFRKSFQHLFSPVTFYQNAPIRPRPMADEDSSAIVG